MHTYVEIHTHTDIVVRSTSSWLCILLRSNGVRGYSCACLQSRLCFNSAHRYICNVTQSDTRCNNITTPWHLRLALGKLGDLKVTHQIACKHSRKRYSHTYSTTMQLPLKKCTCYIDRMPANSDDDDPSSCMWITSEQKELQYTSYWLATSATLVSNTVHQMLVKLGQSINITRHASTCIAICICDGHTD